MKLLVLNVYFAPLSFGGATIVAEETIHQLQQEFGAEILVVTTICDSTILPYAIRRYRVKNVNIIGINVPEECSQQEDINNSSVTERISQIIDLFQPDLVHAHAIQKMGCGYFDHIINHNIPLVITVHDCWWICARQFMIASDGRYCFQKKINPLQCGYCTNEFKSVLKRYNELRSQLNKADLLLFPSKFHHQLHIANDFAVDKCLVNKNGIRLPASDYKKNARPDGRVVFGFVGGPGEIKGSALIIKAFQDISPDKYELRVVDAAKNVGKSWRDSHYWNIPGELRFIPPYSQDTMDEFFSEIDVLLFPSQWKESFGLTVREALSRNVWVIATDAGGVVEDLVDGVNSTIIPLDGDYAELRKAIEAAIERPDWEQYENPHRSQIRGYAEQASELHGYFKSLIERV